jgi:hypothetical protein
MSILVNVFLRAYFTYLCLKMFLGEYDDITTQYEFIDLDHSPAVRFSEMNFLTLFIIYRQDYEMEYPALGEDLD